MPSQSDAPMGGAADAQMPADASTSRGYSNYVLGLLLLVYAINFVDRQIVAILAEPIKRDLGLSDTQLGLLAGPAFAVFYALAGLPMAWLADRYNRAHVISGAMALWSAMTALCGFTANFGQLLLARVGVGIGEAGSTPASHSLLADYFPPERRATAMAIYSTGLSIGVFAGLLIGGWVNELFGWRIAFMIAGAPGLLLALITVLTLRDPRSRRLHPQAAGRAATPGLAASLSTLGRQPAFVWLCLGTALASTVGYASINWFAIYLIRIHELGTGVTGTWLSVIVGVGGGLGTYLGGVLADRAGARSERWRLWLCGIGIAAAAVPMVGAALAPTSDLALLWLALFFPLAFCWIGPAFAMAQSLAPPPMRSVASGVVLLGNNMIGLGAGTLLVGMLSDRFTAQMGPDGLRYAIASVAILALAAGGSFYLSGRKLPDRIG
jgi:predicted MFS family arabinose efflux permease